MKHYTKAELKARAEKQQAQVVDVIVTPVETTMPDFPKYKKTRKPQQRKKVSNYDNVDAGICPHCQDKTLNKKEVAGKGDGVTRTCKKCGHKWYLNRKIHTCKCLTCSKISSLSKKK